jgi:hypothetical protein
LLLGIHPTLFNVFSRTLELSSQIEAVTEVVECEILWQRIHHFQDDLSGGGHEG